MKVWTSTLLYHGSDRIDVGYMSGQRVAQPFLPHFGETKDAYEDRMCILSNEEWFRVVRDEITLCCYCTDPATCHRTTLAALFHEVFCAELMGERSLRILPVRCGVLFCGRGVTDTQALCPEHWNVLPFDLQRDLVRHYTPNQRTDGTQNGAWSNAMGKALAIIASNGSGEDV